MKTLICIISVIVAVQSQVTPGAIFPTGLDNMGLREGHGDHSRCDHEVVQVNERPGQCAIGWFPLKPNAMEVMEFHCANQCSMDDHCGEGDKCCYNGCAYVCMRAVQWA